MSRNTQLIILVNISNALANNGYYLLAQQTYERVLEVFCTEVVLDCTDVSY
jgi:hypothetical protein